MRPPSDLVLASGSPRRLELLSRLHLTPRAVPSGVDETLFPGENAFDAAERLAREKAADVIARVGPEPVVVAADTLVVLDGRALGKPADHAEAREMLRALSDRAHDVVTGVAVGTGGRLVSGRDLTRVVMTPMSDDEIARYVASGEPDDKAGAYALQGIGGLFVARVDGSPSSVVGLPVRLVRELAAELGVDLLP